MNASPRKFISPKEAAGLLEVHVSTIIRWCKKRGKTGIPVYRFGGKYLRIPRDKFYKWAKVSEWHEEA
jgi:excisionase family DNA binding protein